jgi:hypothetical protein
MSWTTFHRGDEILRDVTRILDARLDGRLPMDLPGVSEAFGDELALLAALQLRWHTRLSGRLESTDGPDHDSQVLDAWHRTTDALPGTRLALDRYRAEPLDPAMGTALSTAAAKDHVLLAAAAGRIGTTTPDTARAGESLEERARASYDAAAA